MDKMPGFHISQRAVNSQKVNKIHGNVMALKNKDAHDHIHLKSSMMYLFWIQATTNQIMVKPHNLNHIA